MPHGQARVVCDISDLGRRITESSPKLLYNVVGYIWGVSAWSCVCANVSKGRPCSDSEKCFAPNTSFVNLKIEETRCHGWPLTCGSRALRMFSTKEKFVLKFPFIRGNFRTQLVFNALHRLYMFQHVTSTRYVNTLRQHITIIVLIGNVMRVGRG